MLPTLRGIAREVSGAATVGDALAMNGMDWGVEKRQSFFMLNNGTPSPMPSSFATVRSDNEAMLGRVGGDYVAMKNSDALQHVDALLASGIATLDSVFELKGGKQVGASLRLSEKIAIGGEDPVDLYIVVTTSHDGTRATRTQITPIRLWCTNQLALVSRTAKQSWAVRHLSTMAENLKLVEEELKLITDYSNWLKKSGEKLIQDTLTEIELKAVTLRALDFMPDDSRKEKIVEGVVSVFSASPLIGDEYKGTAWGGLNAVTEYFDHHRDYRSATARYNSITNGVGARMRNTVSELLLTR